MFGVCPNWTRFVATCSGRQTKKLRIAKAIKAKYPTYLLGESTWMKNASTARKMNSAEVDPKQGCDKQAELIAVKVMEELHQDRRHHRDREDDRDAAQQRHELCRKRRPLRRRQGILHFVIVAVALLPDQHSGVIRDQCDQKEVQRSRDQLQHLIGDRERSISDTPRSN